MNEIMGLKIQQLPEEERPQERMVAFGSTTLTNVELLCIILRTGTKNKPVPMVSGELLARFGGLHGLKEASIEELENTQGIGRSKALLLLSVFELASRLNSVIRTNEHVIRSPGDCADLVMEEMRHLHQEHFVCLFLNTKNHVIARKTIFIGSLNASIVHPRELYKEAVRRSAASIICAHNHRVTRS
ncbi:MAG: RadC family protein [Bacilli bacterium]